MESGPASLPVIDGKYQLLRQLGEGGMGAVYEARHKGTGRKVAVKVIAGASLSKNPEVVSRFQREAMASGAIESQYIAQILDTGVDPATGSPYTVMELLVGDDLQQALERLGPLAPELALRVIAQAALGLRKAHESSVVHRDIKPANLFLTKREDGDVVVKLLDFGIAKVKADQLTVAESGGLTRTGAMLGSPLYMSPEQARGKKDLDHRTDIWSLGVVLYETLAGTTPHGHLESIGELILQICSNPPRHVQELAPWVPPTIAEIVHRALSLDPAMRFQSAGEMVDAIRAQLPSGIALTESMFVAMSDGARAMQAPRMTLTSGMRAPAPSFSDDAPPAPTRATRTGVAASTTMGLANSQPEERRRSKMLVVVPVALAMAGIGSLAAWRIASSHHDAPPAAAPIASAQIVPPAASSTAPVSLAPADRTVRVVVLPASAQAQVDGMDAPVQDGTVTITGPLGSVHHVRLTSGKSDKTFDVTVSDDGPMPAKVELSASPVAVALPAAPPRPAAPPAPTPAPTNTSSLHMEMK